MKTLWEKCFCLLQYVIPQALLSRVAGCLANTRVEWIKNPFTRWFVQKYKVNMSEALETDPTAYQTFNDFFTRALKPDARPIDSEDKSIVCPADGAISQLGEIKQGRIFQAKGQEYTCQELLGGDLALSEHFANGQFATVYLSPKDYHRVHMPMTGSLTKMIHIPGDLFSVNNATASHVPRLFSRNERVVCIFETEVGPMAVVLVGAMIVASIETVWAGQVTPQHKHIQQWDYAGNQAPIVLEKGAEMGRFKLGSTAIVLFGKDVMNWAEGLEHQTPTRMGEKMGSVF